MKKPKITTPKLEKNPASHTGKPMGFKPNEEERTAILAKAKRLAGGNLSAFLREAALKYEPEGK
jgi:hypothetical protein